MRDLYSSLGLSPSSIPEAIREAIQANASLAEAAIARQVLLSPERKRVYDRAYVTAARIGKLEGQLGLPADEPTLAFRTAAPGAWRELAVYANANRPPPKKNNSWILKLLAWVALPGGIYLLLSFLPKSPSTVASSQSTPVTTPKGPRYSALPAQPTPTPFNQPWVVFPTSGSYKTHTNKALGAPFKIVSQVGDPNNYYCKLINAQTGITEMEMYVASGFSAEFEVPLGTYRLKFASGTIWYGEKYLFGDSTVCTEAKALFEFKVEGNRYVGNTVELYRRPGGNLHTEVIPRSDF
jgi:hypothetical protein